MFENAELREVHQTFKALRDPWRRIMVEVAAIQPASLTLMCDYLPIQQQTVSYHLKILCDAKLLHIAWAKRGAYVQYTPNIARLEQLKHYIDTTLIPASVRERRALAIPCLDTRGANAPANATGEAPEEFPTNTNGDHDLLGLIE